MRSLGEIEVCTTRLLVLNDGGKTYYINPEARVAYEGIEEALQEECPWGGGDNEY